jgi:hypothetical protein
MPLIDQFVRLFVGPCGGVEVSLFLSMLDTGAVAVRSLKSDCLRDGFRTTTPNDEGVLYG